VVQTRRHDDGVRRERLCLFCHDVFDTIEKHLSTATRPCTAPAWCTVMGIKQ
jgi:hypothetical protein